jgi:hypothetical protein
MSDGTINIPTWAMPILISGLGVAIAYGSSMAEADATKAEVARIEVIVKETAKQASVNGKSNAVTETKVDAIIDSLARQEKIQEKTNEQIQALVQALLAKG